MSAPATLSRPRALLAAALAGAERMVDPFERAGVPVATRARPVVAVVALRPRCGTTTVARALAVELARRDPGGAATVCGRVGRGTAPGSRAGARLARSLAAFSPGRATAAGRLCLLAAEDQLLSVTAAAMDVAPLVLDVPSQAAACAAASLADHVVLVAPPYAEPALAAVVGASLARFGTEPIRVVNRVRDPSPWAGRDAIMLADSRVGARLAGAGTRTRGALGTGLEELTDRCGVSP